MMETPRSKTGLIGRNAIEMRHRKWGELTAIRQSMQRGWWWFRHDGADQAEFTLDAGKVRKDDAKGIEAKCPLCKECAP